jgi:fructose-1-phosphate kinase PfkB-like protein
VWRLNVARVLQRLGDSALALCPAGELNSGAEYRFVMPGSTLAEPEWQACL